MEISISSAPAPSLRRTPGHRLTSGLRTEVPELAPPFVRKIRSAHMGTPGNRGGEPPGRFRSRGHETRSLGEFGKERGTPYFERRELGPELSQLAVYLL